MKILAITDLVFQLPDNFDGTLKDAMKELYLYHTKIGINNQNRKIMIKKGRKVSKRYWNMFFAKILPNKLLGAFFIGEWDGVEWKNLNEDLK
jgi:hypothetical protein